MFGGKKSSRGGGARSFFFFFLEAINFLWGAAKKSAGGHQMVTLRHCILSLSLASLEQQYLQDLSTSVGEIVLEAYRRLSMFKSCALDLIQAIFFLAW